MIYVFYGILWFSSNTTFQKFLVQFPKTGDPSKKTQWILFSLTYMAKLEELSINFW